MAFRSAGVALLVALTIAPGCAALPAAAVLVAQGPRRPAPSGSAVPASSLGPPSSNPGPAAAATVELPPQDAPRFAHEQKLLDLNFPTHRFLLYSFGGQPALVRENCLKGTEIHAALISRARRMIVYEQSEGAVGGGLSIDYAQASAGVYEFTLWTDDPRAPLGDDGVPFVATRVVVAPDGRCYPKRRLLLEAEPGDAGDIQRWHDRAIASPRADVADLDAFAEAMLHLRNLAVNHPDEALAALDDLKGHLGDRVHLSELWSDRKAEIETIRALRPDPRASRTARTGTRAAPRPAATAPAHLPVGPLADPTAAGVHDP